MKFLYECDGKACGEASDKESCAILSCAHTSNIYHAKNFDIVSERQPNGELRDIGAIEKTRKKTIVVSANILYKSETLKKLQNTITEEYEKTGFVFLPPGWSYKEIDGDADIMFDTDGIILKEETSND